MNIATLYRAIRDHAGEFLCEKIGDESVTKVVYFRHIIESPSRVEGVPEVGGLREFYETFGSVTFFHDENSGDAARYIASPSEWAELHSQFGEWLEILPEEERSEAVPEWVESCLVIGETPCSGNYIVVAIEGPDAGRIFEFDHDGFEFSHAADDIVAYVGRLLNPDGSMLTEIAAHMRFTEDGSSDQWWIKELRDNQGRVVQTRS